MSVYIYDVHILHLVGVQHLLFPIPFCHTSLPPSQLPISTRPTSSRWVPPYVPWFCLRFLPDKQGVFSCLCCHCACTKGVSGSGLCKAPRDNCIVMALYKKKLNLIEFN